MAAEDKFIVARAHQAGEPFGGPIVCPDVDDPQDLFLRHIEIEFLALSSEEDEGGLFNGKDEGKTVALLHGTIILGEEMLIRHEDFWDTCDACSSDLEAFATELQNEGSIQDLNPTCCNVLYIDNLELATELIDSNKTQELFSMIPKTVFLLFNIWPTIMGYLIASADGYYESQTKSTRLDPRSVDGYSPLIFTENGFELSSSANALFCIPEW